jgi:hypothetical protein
MRLRAFVLVLLVLSALASGLYSAAPQACGADTEPEAFAALAQGDPQKKGKEEKDRAGSGSPSPDAGKGGEPVPPRETPSSPKDFVPSEKIDADKAVDFPVDI